MDAELRQLIRDSDDNEIKCRLAAAYVAGKRVGQELLAPMVEAVGAVELETLTGLGDVRMQTIGTLVNACLDLRDGRKPR